MLPALLLVLTANPALDEARALYDQFKFKEALRKLDWASARMTPEERVDVELLSGLCRFNLNQAEAAKVHFQRALELDPNIELPRGTTPKAREVFDKLKAERRRALGAAAPGTPAPPAAPAASPAATSAPTAPTPTASPALAPAPSPAKAASAEPASVAAEPGPPRSRSYAGPLGLGLASLASVGAGIALGVVAQGTAAQARAAVYEDDAFRLGGRAQGLALGANLAYGLAGALALAALAWLLFG